MLQGRNLELQVELPARHLGSFAGIMEALPRFRGALRQHRMPGHGEFLGAGLIDAIHLIGPGELAGHIAVFPAPHFGGALSFSQKIGHPVDFRHIDAAVDRAHRIPGGVALNEATLQYGPVAPTYIPDAVGRRPASAVEQS